MKKVLYILFHRSVVVGVSLLAQIITLAVMVTFFSEYTQRLLLVLHRLSVIAAMIILAGSMDPAL